MQKADLIKGRRESTIPIYSEEALTKSNARIAARNNRPNQKGRWIHPKREAGNWLCRKQSLKLRSLNLTRGRPSRAEGRKSEPGAAGRNVRGSIRAKKRKEKTGLCERRATGLAREKNQTRGADGEGEAGKPGFRASPEDGAKRSNPDSLAEAGGTALFARGVCQVRPRRSRREGPWLLSQLAGFLAAVSLPKASNFSSAGGITQFGQGNVPQENKQAQRTPRGCIFLELLLCPSQTAQPCFSDNLTPHCRTGKILGSFDA